MTVVGTGWTFEPIAAAGLGGAALFYGAAIHRLSLKNRRWSRLRTAAFAGGLLTIVVATQSPLAAQDTRLFSAHVFQHLLLSMVAPALLCLGAPITLWLQGARRPTQERLLKVLHSRLVRFVTCPLVTWMLFAGTLFVLYFSGLYELSLRNTLFHEVVHLHFIVAGFLFFSPIVAIDPHPWRMHHGLRLLYVGLTLPVHAFLALALMSATTPLAADWYLVQTARDMGQILRDQKLGAAIMWISGDLIAISVVAIVVTQWAKQEDRASVREDRYVDQRTADLAQEPTAIELDAPSRI